MPQIWRDERLRELCRWRQHRRVRQGGRRHARLRRGLNPAQLNEFVIVHADTRPAQGWHDRLQRAIRLHSQASMLVLGQRFPPFTFPTLLIEGLNEMRVIFGDQTMVLRRRALETCGGFPDQPLMEDVEVSLRLREKGDIIYLGQEWRVSPKPSTAGGGKGG